MEKKDREALRWLHNRTHEDVKYLIEQSAYLHKKLDRTEEDVECLIAYCAEPGTKYGRIEKSIDEARKANYNNFKFREKRINQKLDRIENLQSKMRDNIFTIRKRTDDTDEFLLQHDDDSMKLIGELDCKLDRIERSMERFFDMLAEGMGNIHKNQARMEKLLEEIWGDI